MKNLEDLHIIKTEDGKSWRYDGNSSYRYVLELIGDNPLVCIGANSSTAVPGALDPTLKTVERIAAKWGWDGFIMLNLSPIRATDPADLPVIEPPDMYKENIDWITSVISKHHDVYCAWGNLIKCRKYMNIWGDITLPDDINWYSRGKVSISGNPHHPLYVRDDEPLLPFDMNTYINNIMKGKGENV